MNLIMLIHIYLKIKNRNSWIKLKHKILMMILMKNQDLYRVQDSNNKVLQHKGQLCRNIQYQWIILRIIKQLMINNNQLFQI